jgi:hypothetical protein
LQTPAWQRLWTPSIATGFAITLLAYLQATVSLLPIPTRFDPVVLRLAGWDTLAAQIETMRVRTGANFIAADQYGVASELAYVLSAPIVGIESRWTLFDLPHANLAGQIGILVHVGSGAPDRTPWSTMTELGTVERATQTLRIYRVTATVTPVDARLLARN